jgi:formylglycine-generating enzyme required for sulfatase activity
MLKNQFFKRSILLLTIMFSSVSFSQSELTPYVQQDISTLDKNSDNYAEDLKQFILNELTFVEGGEFMMGSDLPTARDREKPAHKVILDDYYIGKTEVTQSLFVHVMKWDYSYFQCATCAVNNISWFNALLFIERVNEITGLELNFPSEAQWEYAAKGGNKSRDYLYSGSDNIAEVAWYSENANKKSHPVAQLKANELGLYDMTGNLWEFCLDDMSRGIYSRPAKKNPLYLFSTNNKTRTMKVIRGSGYEFFPKESEVFRRDAATNNVRMPDIGFRLAMSLDGNNE